jgi:hypothetical protein
MGSGCMGAMMGIPGTIDGFKIDIGDVLASVTRLAACESPDVAPDERSGASMLNFDGDSPVDLLLVGGDICGNRLLKSSRALPGIRGSEKFVLLTLICSPVDFSEQRSDLCCIG